MVRLETIYECHCKKFSLADSNTAEEGKDDSKKEDKEEETKMEDIAIKNPLLSNIHDFLGKKIRV